MELHNAHFVANVAVGLTLYIVGLLIVWLGFGWGVGYKILSSLLGLLVTAHITHRLLPQFIGPIIERLYKHR